MIFVLAWFNIEHSSLFLTDISFHLLCTLYAYMYIVDDINKCSDQCLCKTNIIKCSFMTDKADINTYFIVRIKTQRRVK